MDSPSALHTCSWSQLHHPLLPQNLHLYVPLFCPIPTQCRHLPSWRLPKSSQCLEKILSFISCHSWTIHHVSLNFPSSMCLVLLLHLSPLSLFNKLLHQRLRPPGFAQSAGHCPMLISWSLSIVPASLPSCSNPFLGWLSTMFKFSSSLSCHCKGVLMLYSTCTLIFFETLNHSFSLYTLLQMMTSTLVMKIHSGVSFCGHLYGPK